MPITFTNAEIQLILADITMPAGTYDVDELIKTIGDAIDIDALKASLFTGAATPESLAAATQLATRQARKIAANLTKAELSKIAEKVRQNIEAGGAFDTLFAKLTEIKGLDKNRAATLDKFRQELLDRGVSPEELQDKVQKMHDKLLRDRQKTIAQTEQAMAQGDGNNDLAGRQGAKWKRWITAQDDLVSDMDEVNQAQGWIPFDEAFDSGDNNEPSHPNCRCSVTYRNNPPASADKQRVENAAKKTAAAKAKGI
jgi:phosphoserine phosphatase